VRNYLRLLVIPAVAIGFDPASASAREVQSLRITVEPVETGLNVLLTNNGVTAATGWQFSVTYLTIQGHPVSIALREDVLRVTEPSESYGPIQPGATRTIFLPSAAVLDRS
jgi:hypothetical protein